MICIPITARKTEEVMRQIDRANKLADIIELRIDYLENIDEKNLAALIGKAKKKVIVTNRPKREKGFFRGSEAKRVALLKNALRLGAHYIDLEFSTKPKLRAELLKKKFAERVILSHHNFRETPPLKRLLKLFERMRRSGAGIIKIVTYARIDGDNFVPLSLIKYAKQKRQRAIAFCMGPLGRDSRILCVPLGAFLTYCSLASGQESAPGQIPAAEMRSMYNGFRVML